MDEALIQVEKAVGDLADRSVRSLGDADLVNGLVRLSVVASQLAVVTAAFVREIDGRAIPAAHGASSTPVWLREQLRISIHTARKMTDLATLIDARPALRDALVSGRVNPEQVAVIGATLAELPRDLDAAVADKAEVVDRAAIVDKAEALLVDHAGQFEPAILRRLGERILAHVAPEIADEALRRKLDHDEVRATSTGH